MGESLFRYLWGEGLPDGAALLVWTMPNKASIWCWDIEDAEKAVSMWAGRGMEVYFGVGLVRDPAAISRRKGTQVNYVRGDASDISHIAALWADVDFKHISEEEAWDRLLAMTYPPTLIVHSGHGFHCYWVFGRPIVIEDAERWQAVSAGWQAQVATELHTKLDSAWDLSRVLRVPGTTNYKAEPVPVRLTEHRGPTYHPELFMEYARQRAEREVAPEVGRIKVNNPPQLDTIRFDALLDSDPQVRATWERRRRNLGDDSPSGYDMALASYALGAGWDVQEACDLLVAWRLKHDEPVKREDYYQRTLERAAATVTYQRSFDVENDDTVATLSHLWGVPIERFVCYQGDISRYELHIEGAYPVTLGAEKDLLNQHSVRGAVLKATGKVIPRVKSIDWDQQLRTLMSFVEYQDAGAEARATTWYSEMVHLYLDDEPPVEPEEDEEYYNEVVRMGRPIRIEGVDYITSKRFGRWLRIHYNDMTPSRDLAMHFSRIGWRGEKINTRGRTGRTSRTYWRVR